VQRIYVHLTQPANNIPYKEKYPVCQQNTYSQPSPVQSVDVHLAELPSPRRPRQRMSTNRPQPVMLHHLAAYVVAQVGWQHTAQVLQHCAEGVFEWGEGPL
jgi:hypothetical protein